MTALQNFYSVLRNKCSLPTACRGIDAKWLPMIYFLSDLWLTPLYRKHAIARTRQRWQFRMPDTITRFPILVPMQRHAREPKRLDNDGVSLDAIKITCNQKVRSVLNECRNWAFIFALTQTHIHTHAHTSESLQSYATLTTQMAKTCKRPQLSHVRMWHHLFSFDLICQQLIEHVRPWCIVMSLEDIERRARHEKQTHLAFATTVRKLLSTTDAEPDFTSRSAARKLQMNIGTSKEMIQASMSGIQDYRHQTNFHSK